MNYKSYNDLNLTVRSNLYKLYGHNFDLVVGIPRSGILPAYMIALSLNIHCTDLVSFLNNLPLKKGITRKTKHQLDSAWDATRILLVDDSIMSGKSLADTLASTPENLRKKITTLAVYSSLPIRQDVDIFLEFVPIPRIFEWNIFHHNILSKSCIDIDGVLCIDPTDEQNDDGERYIDFLLNAQPYLLPSGQIHSLVTNRLEKYRPQTEAWLKKHGVRYDSLIMLDLPNKEERIRNKAHSSHKADYYNKSGLLFFIESDPRQASQISQLTGKPVFCVDDNTMYKPGMLHTVYKNPKAFKTKLKHYLKLFPQPLQNLVHSTYYRFKAFRNTD